MGRLLFNVLGMVAEFEADLIRMRTREGIAVAKARGRPRGKQPKLSLSQRKHLLDLAGAGVHTQAELAELFRISRTTFTASSSELEAEPPLMASTVPLSAVPASHTSRCVMPGRYHPAGVIGECPERDVAETIQAEILAMPDPSAVVEDLPRIRRS